MQFRSTTLAACNACGLPIRNGMEVSHNNRTYHPGCIGRLMKERKDERRPEQKSAA